MPLKCPLKVASPGVAALVGALLLAAPAAAAPPQPVAAEQQMQKMLQSYTPELREKVTALSPETRARLIEMLSVHTNRSEQATFRQVMQEVLADYQAIVAGIATDNPEMTADAARRLANHRLPKGGLYPYFDLANLNDADMIVLPAMNEAVEGSAERLAEAAERGNMAGAANHLSQIMAGCVACHAKFRGQPGVSQHLRAPGR